MPRLSGPQLKTLRKALLDALPMPADWEEAVRFGLNVNLDDAAAPGRLPFRAFEVLRWTEARNVTDELIAAALDAAPKNLMLRDSVQALRLNTATRFESIVRERLQFAEVGTWRTDMLRSERAVCRVEENLVGEDQPLGTGFLVANDLVITNYHVVERYAPGRISASRLSFRFDYKIEDGAIGEGTRYVPGDPWLVASSPKEQLDYALVRLAETAGTRPVGDERGSRPRGFLTPSNEPLAERDPLMIIQHPKAVPLKFAIGTVTGFGSGGNVAHVAYDVNTQDGSSGSPCFSSDWSLVALHQCGGAKENQGILFSAILGDLAAKNVAL